LKLIHTSDLHLGISLYGYSLIEDQKYILDQIIQIAEDEKTDGIIIAGDVYDKSIPSVEAIKLFENFLKEAAERKINVFIISGNHDSAERLTFGSEFMKSSGIYFSDSFCGSAKSVQLKDSFGNVNLWLLPFIRPQNVRPYFSDREIPDYNTAVKTVIDSMGINSTERNILVTHQNVTNAIRCDSEELIFGGLDNINSDIFSDFDYVALGHIHSPQHIQKESVRYCGTPLKYSASEINQKKSVTVIELKEKSNLNIRTRELQPLHDMRQIKDSFDSIIKNASADTKDHEDYINIVLTDETDIPDAMSRLRQVYPRTLQIEYDNYRTQHITDSIKMSSVKKMNPEEVFRAFYYDRTESELTEDQTEYLKTVIEEIWSNEE